MFAAVTTYISQRLSVAVGIIGTGYGVGTLVGSYLVKYLLDEYGSSGCLLMIAGISLNTCALSLSFCPPTKCNSKRKESSVPSQDMEKQNQTRLETPAEAYVIPLSYTYFGPNSIATRTESGGTNAKTRKTQQKGLPHTDMHPYKVCMNKESVDTNGTQKASMQSGNVTFICLIVSLFTFHMATTCRNFIVPLAMERNISELYVSMVLLTMGIVEVGSPVILGYVLELQQAIPYRVELYTVLLIVYGGCILLMALIDGRHVLVILSGLASCPYGSIYVLLSSIIERLFGLERMPYIYGVANCAMGLSSFAWPFLIGM